MDGLAFEVPRSSVSFGNTGTCTYSGDGERSMSIHDEMSKYYWWHTIELQPGVWTPGMKTKELMDIELSRVFDSVDLRGKSVLDVGAWTGGFSIEAKRRGAKRVVALDHFTWTHPDVRARDAFDFAVKTAGLEIEAVEIDLATPRLSLDHLGKFDIVLYLGVFYHLVDPISVTEEVGSRATETLILETYLTDMTSPIPNMTFYPGTELVGDPTNWWGPNKACVEALLRHFSFKTVRYAEGAAFNRGIFHAAR
jgi:tRNA (mo5U34)-methyltransferase